MRTSRKPTVDPSDAVSRGLLRVPEITVAFWAIKILTTGMGETLSDFLGTHGNEIVNAAAIVLVFGAVFAVQFRVRRYIPAVYWACVAMVSVLGTVVADVAHAVVGIPYIATSVVFALTVAAILVMWHRSTGSLDVHTITSRQPEIYYWATVMATFALGTALGDLTASSLHLGYLASTALFAAVIVVPLIAWRRGASPILTFWAAYVVTRPLGASAADWLADPTSKSGLGWGTGPVTAAWLLAIVALVTFVAVGQRRTSSSAGSDSAPPGAGDTSLARPLTDADLSARVPGASRHGG
ncbi:COG4705 family protein [Williamsia sp. M5A3_1d]